MPGRVKHNWVGSGRLAVRSQVAALSAQVNGLVSALRTEPLATLKSVGIQQSCRTGCAAVRDTFRFAAL